MFKQKQWLAVIRGNHWVVAKVARRKNNLDILRLSEFRAEPESESEPEHGQQLGEKDLVQKEQVQEVKYLKGEKKTASIKAWLDANRVPLNKLRVSVSCPGVITRMITLPIMSTQDMDKLLTLHVDQYFTINISDYVVDYRVLERLIEDGEKRQKVLLAALPKYQWEALWSEWKNIGFKPKIVDLAADGLARLYSQLTPKGKSTKSTTEVEAPLDIAIIELSADRVEFILLEHGVFFLYSDLEVALDELDQVATTVKRATQELGRGRRKVAEGSELQTARLIAWAKAEIEITLSDVLQSVAEFFGFFAARHFGKSIDLIYLTGDYSDLPFIQEIFESNLGVATQVGFPNAWHPNFSRRIKTLQENEMKYGSLYGLALREG